MRETVLDILLLQKIIFFLFGDLNFIPTKTEFVIFDLCFIIFSHPLCSLSVCIFTIHPSLKHCTVLKLWMSPKGLFKKACTESPPKYSCCQPSVPHYFTLIPQLLKSLLEHWNFRFYYDSGSLNMILTAACPKTQMPHNYNDLELVGREGWNRLGTGEGW